MMALAPAWATPRGTWWPWAVVLATGESAPMATKKDKRLRVELKPDLIPAVDRIIGAQPVTTTRTAVVERAVRLGLVELAKLSGLEVTA